MKSTLDMLNDMKKTSLPVPPTQPQLPRYHSANPGFIPRLQLGIIARMECLVCPLHPHTTDNQQWKYTPGLVLMVFCSRVNSSHRSGTDTQRHGQIRVYQTFISRLSQGPSAQTGGAWKLSPVTDFPSFSDHELTRTFPLYPVPHWNHVAFMKYSCSSSLDEKMHSCPAAPSFSAE